MLGWFSGKGGLAMDKLNQQRTGPVGSPASGVRGEEESDYSAPAWKAYERDLMKLCVAKAEEFHFLGYQEATAAQVWQCVLSTAKGKLALHEWVARILGLRIAPFMNFMTLSAYRGVFPGENEAEKASTNSPFLRVFSKDSKRRE